MTVYLVDNSVWQKAHRSVPIAARLRELSPLHLILTCPPQVLEYCHSARTAAEYIELRADMDGLLPAPQHPSAPLSLDVQESLWRAGLARAAGAFDCLIAAYAIANDAVLLNSDRDFEHIERATNGRLRQEYIAE